MMLPMLALKDGIKGKDIRDVIKQMFLIDLTTKTLPFFIGKVFTHFRNRAAARSALIQPGESLRAKSASINIHRIYEKHNENDTFDAIVWRLCQLPQTKHLKIASNNIFVLSNNDIIKIDDDIYIQQKSIEFDEKKGVTECSIEIFSYVSDLINLKEYMMDLVHKFNLHRNNQLGQTIYYFDEIPITLPRLMDNTLNYDAAPKNLTFSMAKLSTNKNLENVYGKSMEIIRKRVNFFANNKKWYQDKGVPYTLGILMYGEPGCGKTSLIKALSKDCQRHVFNIKLTESTTISQINSLFFTEKVVSLVDGVNTSYNIPIDKRIIVLEDIDCLSNIVLDRQCSTIRVAQHQQNPPLLNNTCNAMKNDILGAPQPSTPGIMWNNFNDNMAPSIQMQGFPYGLDRFEVGAQRNGPVPNGGAPYGGGGRSGGTSNLILGDPTESDPKEHVQKLTLSYLLNVLDGVLETPGRIIIMTSNHPDKLDKALIRPGRIDINVHFHKSTKADIKEMIEKISGCTVDNEKMVNIPDHFWTPAEVTQKIFEHMDMDEESNSVDKILQCLSCEDPKN